MGEAYSYSNEISFVLVLSWLKVPVKLHFCCLPSTEFHSANFMYHKLSNNEKKTKEVEQCSFEFLEEFYAQKLVQRRPVGGLVWVKKVPDDQRSYMKLQQPIPILKSISTQTSTSILMITPLIQELQQPVPIVQLDGQH